MNVIPKAGRIRKGKWIDLFRAMAKAGDSFFVPSSIRSFRSFGATLTMVNKKLKPKHFVSRCRNAEGKLESEDGEAGFRVWRSK